MGCCVLPVVKCWCHGGGITSRHAPVLIGPWLMVAGTIQDMADRT